MHEILWNQEDKTVLLVSEYTALRYSIKSEVTFELDFKVLPAKSEREWNVKQFMVCPEYGDKFKVTL